MLNRLRNLNPFPSKNRPFWKRNPESVVLPLASTHNDRLDALTMESNSVNSSLPIHERGVPVDPQSDCPFFNGRLPPEIRDEIFAYALTETSLPVELDPASVYPKDVARPGYTTRRAISIALLQYVPLCPCFSFSGSRSRQELQVLSFKEAYIPAHLLPPQPPKSPWAQLTH